ncbi:MAG: heterodisulfide reductase, partial [Candidatus Thermoplasmatota archaeon]
ALRDARRGGAAALATPCPLCSLVLDGDQEQVERVAGARIRMPILHLPQLVGLAFGLDPGSLGVDRHAVPVRPFVEALTAEEVVHP